MLIGFKIKETLVARVCADFKEILEFLVLTFTQIMQFLGVTIDLLLMTLSLPEKQVSKVQKQRLKLLQETQVSILNLSKLIDLFFFSTIRAVSLLLINFWYLKQQQIQAEVKMLGWYCKKGNIISISKEGKQWWVQNLKICNDCDLSSDDTNRDI